MNVIRPLVLATLVAATTAAMGFAQRESDISGLGRLSTTTNFNMTQAEIGGVVRNIAKTGEIELQITPAAEGRLRRKINMDLRDVTLASALRQFLKAADCSYIVIAEHTLLITAR